MKKPSPPLIALAIAAFLAPVFGGHLQLDNRPLAPGTGLLSAMFTGTEAATLGHAAISALVVFAFLWAVLKQVVQVPQPRIALALMLIVASLFLSTSLSSYKVQSFAEFGEWLLYAFTFATTIAVAGRASGPRLLAGAFGAGCFCVAVSGVKEYLFQPDPGWRIFGGWHHPNALAGILLLGMFTTIGLGLASDRALSTLLLLASGLIGAALALTQSKGGYAAALVGFCCLFLMTSIYAKGQVPRKLGYVLACAIAVVGFTAWFQKMQQRMEMPKSVPVAIASEPRALLAQAPLAAPNSPSNRVFSSAASAEQSFGFRLNLWRTCWRLIQKNPFGYGIGTFRYESAKPGINTQTQLGHNTFFQLAVEASPISALFLIAFLLLCAFDMLRSSRSLPVNQNLFRAGVFAALLASAVHNMVDSDLYHMGIGFGFFLLLGIGLALGADSIVPEFLPIGIRAGGAILATTCLGFLAYDGWVEYSVSELNGEVTRGDPAARDHAVALQNLNPWDPRVWLASSAASPSLKDIESALKESIRLGPSEQAYGRLATLQEMNGETTEARGTLLEALTMDPNNLRMLSQFLTLDAKSDPSEADTIARRMVDVEQTPYFRTRAIPELVATETYDARLYLASKSNEPQTQTELLEPAVDGYLLYAQTTVPYMVKMHDTDPSLPFGNLRSAKAVLGRAIEAKNLLEKAYRIAGRPNKVVAIQGVFDSALASVNGALGPDK